MQCPLPLTPAADVFFRQKCDTFSRSSQAVFELSSRFSKPFGYEEKMDDDMKVERRRLTFLELTQGTLSIWPPSSINPSKSACGVTQPTCLF